MERKNVNILLPLLLLFAVFHVYNGICVYAKSVPVMIIGSNYDANPGENIEVPVTISDVSDLAMIQFALSYDETKLEYVGFQNGSMLPEQEVPTINSEENGKIYYVWDSTESLSGSGELAIFSFRVKDSVFQKTSICIDENEEIVFADSTFHMINPGFVAGNVVIFDFCMPVTLSEIEEEAFAGTAVSCVKFSQNIQLIGPRAFADCTELEYVIIPANAEISSTAFYGLSGLTFLGIPGSSVENFAKANGFSFVEIGGRRCVFKNVSPSHGMLSEIEMQE